MMPANAEHTHGRFGIGVTLSSMASLIAITLGILTPVLPSVAVAFEGRSDRDLLIGVMVTAPTLIAALMGPAAGWFADRVGPRRLMIIGLAGYALFGCAPFLVHDLVGIVLLRFALGFPLIALIVASTAMIAHQFDGVVQIRWLGLQSAFGSLGAVATALIGGGLGQIGWREPFLVHSVALVWIVALLIFVERDAPFAPRSETGPLEQASLEWRPLLINLLTSSFASIVLLTAVVQVSFVLSGAGISDPATIGLGVSIISACAAAGALIAPHVTNLFPRRGLPVAFLLCAVGLILMAWGRDFTVIVVGGSLAAAGTGVAFPLLIGQSVGSVRPELRGRVSGMWTSAVFIGQFLNAPVFALLNSATGSIQLTVAAVAAACAAIACLLAFLAHRPVEA